MTHLLKLLDKMHKYEMDPTRTVGATERTQIAWDIVVRTDRRTEWNQYKPLNNLVVWGYNYNKQHNFKRTKAASPYDLRVHMSLLYIWGVPICDSLINIFIFNPSMDKQS